MAVRLGVSLFWATSACAQLYSAAAGAHCLDPANMRVGPGFTDGATIWLPAASGVGTDAIDLSTGRLLFTVPEAAQPIGLHQGRLVAVTQAQQGTAPFPLRIAVFDGRGQRRLLSKVLALPAWVTAPPPPQAAELLALYEVRGGNAVIHWTATQYVPGKKPGEREYYRRRPVLDQRTTVDLGTGQLTSRSPPLWPESTMFGPSPPSLSAVVITRCDGGVAEAWRLGSHLFSLHKKWQPGERKPHAVALTDWHATTKKELRQVLLADCPIPDAMNNPMWLSADWRHLSTWARSESRADSLPIFRDYLVYDSQTGELLSRLPWSTQNPDGTFNQPTVAAGRIIRVVSEKSEKKLQVYSLTGQLAWERKL